MFFSTQDDKRVDFQGVIKVRNVFAIYDPVSLPSGFGLEKSDHNLFGGSPRKGLVFIQPERGGYLSGGVTRNDLSSMDSHDDSPPVDDLS